tara:strand:- start:605 stop:1312 length:708 start_codon:yes stop_codon:yes gene_type:complete
MLLNIKNLYINIGKAGIVKDISFGLSEGSIFTIVGANGAGKSTFLKCLSGLIKPVSGEVWFNGIKTNGWKPANIVKIGLAQIPEGACVFSKLTVLDNLKAGAYLRKDQKKVKSDYERVFHHFPRLKERLNQKAGTMSGGERQMLAFGRALMNGPKLLLLDEPSLGLSPIMVNEVFKIINNIRDEGVSILLVEQNAKKALELADYALVLENGKIVKEGPAQKLLGSPEIERAYLGG